MLCVKFSVIVDIILAITSEVALATVTVEEKSRVEGFALDGTLSVNSRDVKAGADELTAGREILVCMTLDMYSVVVVPERVEIGDVIKLADGVTNVLELLVVYMVLIDTMVLFLTCIVLIRLTVLNVTLLNGDDISADVMTGDVVIETVLGNPVMFSDKEFPRIDVILYMGVVWKVALVKIDIVMVSFNDIVELCAWTVLFGLTVSMIVWKLVTLVFNASPIVEEKLIVCVKYKLDTVEGVSSKLDFTVKFTVPTELDSVIDLVLGANDDIIVVRSGPIVIFREAIDDVTDKIDILLINVLVLVAGDGNEDNKSNMR